MLRTFLDQTLAFLLSLVNGVFLQIFDNIDDGDALGQVFLHTPTDHHLRTALRAEEDLAIGLDGQSSGDALLAVGVPAARDHPRGAVVDIEVRAAEWAGRRQASGGNL